MTELYQSDVKKPWESKTLWGNLILAGLNFFPHVQEHVTPEIMSVAFLVLNSLLRMVTKSGISLK